MKVLVIIVSYNFEPWLNRCLNSLRSSEHPVSVVVVDNNSSDNTVNRVRAEYPEIRLIENNTNLGFGAANNIGMRIALEEAYDAIFLLNQDAWIDSHTITTLVECLKENSNYGIFSPVHLNGNGTALDSAFAQYIKTQDVKQIAQHSQLIPATFINAAFWMIPAHILKTVGGFSPLFYHYGEDKDYINRLNYHGYSVAYSPKALAFHDRQKRAQTHTSFFRSEKVYHLSEYANINHSLWKGFCYGPLAELKKAFQALVHGKIHNCSLYIYMSISLMGKTCRIVKTRKTVKLKDINYLAS